MLLSSEPQALIGLVAYLLMRAHKHYKALPKHSIRKHYRQQYKTGLCVTTDSIYRKKQISKHARVRTPLFKVY